MQSDGAGGLVYGVWMFNDIGANNGHEGGVPLEVCVALVNEVNAMRPAHPIGMWMNIPHLGLCSMDPDYTIGSSWGIQASQCRSKRSERISLDLTSSSQLFIEYSNETLNSGGGAFAQTYYLAYRGVSAMASVGQAPRTTQAWRPCGPLLRLRTS